MFYCDASAIFKLAVDEVETPLLRQAIAGQFLATSQLSVTEVGRAVARREPSATELMGLALSRLDLIPITRDILRRAFEIRPPLVRTLDAIHLATALALGGECQGIITYDIRMQYAAREAGLSVLAPGQVTED